MDMTEMSEEKPYEPKDPSESFRELVKDIDNGGHDSGDEHQEVPEVKDETAEVPSAPEVDPPDPQEPSSMKSVGDYIDEDLAAVVKDLSAEITRLKSAATKQKTQSQSDQIIDGLGEDWASVFADSANREKLSTAIAVLRVGYEQSKIPVPDEQELVGKALRSEFADIKNNLDQEAVDQKVDKRKSQMISRGSGQRSASHTPKETAMRSVHKMMIDRGLYNS
jgi:hypothetical protein